MQTLLTALQRLESQLFGTDSHAAPDPDAQSRSVLGIVVRKALAVQQRSAQVIPDPMKCPNCDVLATSVKSPYCGEPCREEAGFVRQVRAGLAEGTILDEERQVSLGQVVWHVLGGGYPRRQTLILERDRAKVLSQDSGLCRICGSPATSVEHIRTGCNRTINLRSVCAACAKTKQFGDKEFLARSDAQLDRIAERIASPVALLCCDDPVAWDWRAYIAKRKKMTR